MVRIAQAGGQGVEHVGVPLRRQGGRWAGRGDDPRAPNGHAWLVASSTKCQRNCGKIMVALLRYHTLVSNCHLYLIR